VGTILRQLFDAPTFMSETALGDRKPDWWMIDSRLAESIKQLRTDIDATDFGQASDLYKSLRHLLRRIGGPLDDWLNRDSAKSFRSLSVLNAWSATFWEGAGNYTLSILLCHRCIDFFLTAQAWEANLIYFDGERIRYSYEASLDRREKHDTSITGLEKALVQNGIWARDRNREKFFRDLNLTRNRLVLTHGAFRSSANECAWALRQTRSIVGDYLAEVKHASNMPESLWSECVTESVLFYFERDFADFVEPVF